jgi:hypothetical protein
VDGLEQYPGELDGDFRKRNNECATARKHSDDSNFKFDSYGRDRSRYCAELSVSIVPSERTQHCECAHQRCVSSANGERVFGTLFRTVFRCVADPGFHRFRRPNSGPNRLRVEFHSQARGTGEYDGLLRTDANTVA